MKDGTARHALPASRSDLNTPLTAKQREVVIHKDGPMLVVAGPGSGKTRVITHRVATQIASGRARANQVLAVTFTRAAASEMRTRILALLGTEERLHVGTFHWMCSAILRRHIHRLGYTGRFRLLSPAQARAAMSDVLGDACIGSTAGRISAAVNSVKNGASVESEAAHHGVDVSALQKAISLYDGYKRERDLVDLDDLLVLTVQLLQRVPDVRSACRAAHSDIVVDEFQDVNPVQQSLLSLLAPPNHNIVVVGDDDQAIYSWRQALPQSLVAFQKLFPGCHTVTLQTNFRSSRHIVRAANALIRHNAHRLPREMQTDIEAGKRPVCVRTADEVEEADSIAAMARRIHERDHCAWEDIAVLFRLNSLARVLEDACLRHGVPCQIQARYRFYDRPEVRHALAYIRLAIDRTDIGAAAILIGHVRGVGPARLARLERHLEAHGLTMAHLLHEGGANTAQLPDGMKAEVLTLSEHVGALQSLRQSAIPSVVDAVIRLTQDDFRTRGGVTDGDDNFLGEIASIALDVHQRRGTLRSLVELLDRALPGGVSSGGVRLLSLHAAKGLEFHAVFLCGLEEGILPYERALGHAQAVEEERRLCYVGMTRARRQLILSYARRRTISGESIVRSRSRFIGEIGPVDLKFEKPLVAGPRSQQPDTVDKTDSTDRSAGDTTRYV